MTDTDHTDESGSEPPEGPDPPDGQAADQDEQDAADSAYRRRVGVILALLAILGGVIGVIEVRASTNEAFYARETTRTAVEAEAANVTGSAVDGLDVDLGAELEGLALSRVFTAEGRSAEAAVDEVTTGAVVAEDDDLALAAERLTLKQQALAETRVTWNSRASQYGTVLTTLGVALFLVGFTLVLNRRIRPPILVPGLLLAAYCAGWTAWIWQRDIPDTADAAIEATADGNVLVADGDYDDAVLAFDRAIEADDDYDVAFTGRAAAGFLATNPDFQTTSAVTDVESELFADALADADTAIELSDGRDVISVFIEALTSFYAGDYDDAVDGAREAVEINDQVPDVFLLEAAAELARGDLDAAGAAADSATALLELGELSQRNRITFADVFTLLERVAEDVPEQTELAESLVAELAKDEAGLVFGEVSGEVPEGATIEITELAWADDVLTAAIAYDGLPDATPVSILVFERPLDGGAWVQPFDLALFAELSGSGTEAGSVEAPRSCPPTELRMDVYVEGALAASEVRPGVEGRC